MAINKIDQPSGTTPIAFAGYTQQNELIKGNSVGMAPRDMCIKDLASTSSTVVIEQGTYFYNAGEVYETQTTDESITGTISAGLNWIILTVSGSTLTASWSSSPGFGSTYIWNNAYQGWYSGTSQVIPMGIWLDGSTYNRFKAFDSRNPYYGCLGDGRILTDDMRIVSTATAVKIKGVNTQGEDIDAGGGNIITSTGYHKTAVNGLQLNNNELSVELASPSAPLKVIQRIGSPSPGTVNILTRGGAITTYDPATAGNGGPVETDGGDISSGGGNIRTGGGFLGTNVVSSVPASGDGENGDILIYNSGGVRRAYFKAGGAWYSVVVS